MAKPAAAAFTVEGLDRFQRTLRKAGADMDDLKATHAEMAGVVTGAVNAPVRSGRLAATVRPGATRRAAVVRAGRAAVPYAGPIHWGWPSRGIRAQPFLTDAAVRTEPTWSGVFADGIQKILDQVKGK